MTKKIIEFFKSSPLSKRELVFRLTASTLLSLAFIAGGIYLLITDPKNMGAFAFIPLGLILGLFTILGLNLPKAEEWFMMKDEKDQPAQ